MGLPIATRPTNAASMSDPDPILMARGVTDADAYMTLATDDRRMTVRLTPGTGVERPGGATIGGGP
jgi:hypothetical protein